MGKGWIKPGVEEFQAREPVENYTSAIESAKLELALLQSEISKFGDVLKHLKDETHEVSKEKIKIADELILHHKKVHHETSSKFDEVCQLAKEHNANVAQFEEEKKQHDIEFNSHCTRVVESHKDIDRRESELVQLKNSLDDRDSALIKQEGAMKALREKLYGEIELLQKDKVLYRSDETELEKEKSDVNQKLQDLEIKSKKCRADLIELDQRTQDFEDTRIHTEALSQQTKRDLISIQQKVDQNKGLILENARIQADVTNKLNLLREESSKHAQQINELTSLRNQLISQGENNAK